MKRLAYFAGFCLYFLMQPAARGQAFDVAFGMGTLTAPSASSASGKYQPVSLTGGLYPSFSGDFLFKGRFGVQSEVAWRAGKSSYAGFFPYRPIFYDFNGIYAPRFGKSAGAELMAGIGVADIRFYGPFINCGSFGCSNFTSSNHFLGHFGGGLRLYVHGNFFIRPEAHLYLIRNNFEFSSGRATRFGMSIGYTLGPPQY